MFLCLLALLTTMTLISACQPSDSSMPVTTPADSLALPAPTTSTLDTGTYPLPPTKYLEFSNLSDLQKVSKFPIWLPGYIPDDLPFVKGWISDYANGSGNVRLLFSQAGNIMDANLKSLDIQMAKTDEIVSGDSIAQQFKMTALDIRTVQVRGQTGFTYWTQSVTVGNSAHLDWREEGINFSISVFGAWPQPDESNPHGLDDVLIKIARSLQTVQ